jgi:hypothetical protein
MAPSGVAKECITGKMDIQFLGEAFSSLGSEKKSRAISGSALNGGLVLKSFSRRAKS